MSLLGWIISLVGGLALGIFGDELGLSGAKKYVACALLGVACLFIFPSGGVKADLERWALNSGYLDYDDVSIRRVEKLSEGASFDYKIYADIEQGSIRSTVYLFVKLNSSETNVLRVHKDDSEFANSLINDIKGRTPEIDW